MIVLKTNMRYHMHMCSKYNRTKPLKFTSTVATLHTALSVITVQKQLINEKNCNEKIFR